MPNYHQASAVQSLTSQGKFQVRSVEARGILREYLGDRGFEAKLRTFARAAVSGSVQAKMFCRTTHDTRYGGRPTAYDVYGVRFSKAELIGLGFPEEEDLPLHWMLKLAIVDGDVVDILSPHPVNGPLRLESGVTLIPRTSND